MKLFILFCIQLLKTQDFNPLPEGDVMIDINVEIETPSFSNLCPEDKILIKKFKDCKEVLQDRPRSLLKKTEDSIIKQLKLKGGIDYL